MYVCIYIYIYVYTHIRVCIYIYIYNSVIIIIIIIIIIIVILKRARTKTNASHPRYGADARPCVKYIEGPHDSACMLYTTDTYTYPPINVYSIYLKTGILYSK